MRSAIALLSVVSLASVAVAQDYGRFPCSLVNGDGTLSPDPNQCLDDALIPPGDPTSGTGFQIDGPTPTGATCARAGQSGAYYCGIAGAPCTVDANCDNGTCEGGVCRGGLTTPCTADAQCSGNLYCTDIEGNVQPGATCGGLGSFCNESPFADPDGTPAENYPVFNQYCASGYCGVDTGVCEEHATEVGADCSFDPDFACTVDEATGAQLTCIGGACAIAPQPTGARARARRAGGALFKRRACPLSHTACSVQGQKGFECIDTNTNIEQCEIWSCVDGFEYDSASESCIRNIRA
ncbi:hypothetical protein Rhopal_000144-T1 [Rhodotorula paludigena]|uniref:Antifreeze glycopeptide AFGP polyprotein n=1 Tax=Rhodotorula paludigena TaxID=86838 RepID=A0AAV5GCX2_9BASI|nr:hypothetical protein Rhopal_000144-T1 [Rhodotorula paludigena]